MTTPPLHPTEIAELAVWRTLQTRIIQATGLRLGLWDAEPARLLPEPLMPAACQYVQAEKGRRERCEQFHRSVRSDVRRNRRSVCAQCPFGVRYVAAPLCGEGMFVGHWEGGFVVDPELPPPMDPGLDPDIWRATLSATPQRSEAEVRAALDLLEMLHGQVVTSLALRERRRSQVTQLIAYDLGRVLEASPSLQEPLSRFVYLVAQVIGVPIALLLFPERESGELVVVASEGLGPEAIPTTRLRHGEGVAGRVLEAGVPILVNDLQRDPRFRFPHPPFDKLRSLLGVPVRQHGEVIGVLDVGSYAPNAFDHDDVGLLQALAALIEGLLAQEAHAWPLKDLAPLSGSLREAGEAVSEGPLLEPVLDLVLQVMRASSATLLLLDPATERLTPQAFRGTGTPAGAEGVALGEGVVGWVAQAGEPLYLPDVTTDSRFLTVRAGLKSELAVPLWAEGRVVGVLDVGTLHPQYFSAQQVQQLTLLAKLAVLAWRIENRPLAEGRP